jgi:RHS repeat-associated protein
VQAGTYDYNWHWYDGDGRRILTQASSGTTIVAPRPEIAGGILSYYVYDGSDVALVLARQARGRTWWVKQRPLVGGVDQVLAGRYSAAGTQYQNLALVADRQGSTVAAVKSDGSEELSALYPGRNAFGALEGASAGGGTNTESGYTGASTPNQTGGFTYLRNRWYDPATGRFLTQDPIGLAGGVNLYAYAGNDPVSYSDPFGLCPTCLPALVAGVAVGGIRLGANLLSDRPAFENVGRDAILAGAAVLTLGAAVPGIAAATVDVAGAAKLTVQFGKVANQVSHTFRHTDAAGLDRAQVQAAVEEHLTGVASQIAPGKPLNQIIEVAGQRIQYTAYQVSEGVVNVGRIHPVE